MKKPTHTKGGHEIKNFRKLRKPIIRYGYMEQIYSGRLRNDYTGKMQECTWDANGEVINRCVPKYDIAL